MDTKRSTTSGNNDYNLISVLYHALQEAQTVTKYMQDAELSGNEKLLEFLRDVHQEALGRAERAEQLLELTERMDEDHTHLHGQTAAGVQNTTR